MRDEIIEIFDSRCNAAGFWFDSDADSCRVYLPYWTMALVALALAAGSAPTVPQFSLRTLLIGMTLVAVVLGLAVWAVR